MFPGNTEYVARERHQDMLREAERRRLVEMAQQGRPGPVQQLANWTGGQLVKWGTKLQGQSISLPAQPTAAAINETKCC
jgi:hypothetical protein